MRKATRVAAACAAAATLVTLVERERRRIDDEVPLVAPPTDTYAYATERAVLAHLPVRAVAMHDQPPVARRAPVASMAAAATFEPSSSSRFSSSCSSSSSSRSSSSSSSPSTSNSAAAAASNYSQIDKELPLRTLERLRAAAVVQLGLPDALPLARRMTADGAELLLDDGGTQPLWLGAAGREARWVGDEQTILLYLGRPATASGRLGQYRSQRDLRACIARMLGPS